MKIIKNRWAWYLLSGILVGGSIVLLAVFGPVIVALTP